MSESDTSELDDTEAKKYVRYINDGKTVEIISPNMKGVLKIKGSKVNIAPNPIRFEELKYIEKSITDMSVIPDFGYEKDNYILDRGPDAPKNWKLLTDFIWNRDKYMWLQNHLVLRKLRAKQKAHEDNKKQIYSKNVLQAKLNEETSAKKTHKMKHADKEMNELLDIKKDVNTTSRYLRKMQKINGEVNKKIIMAKVEPQVRFGSTDRRSLVERQGLLKIGDKSRASLSPE